MDTATVGLRSLWAFTQASAGRLVAYVTGRADVAATIHPTPPQSTPGGAPAWVNRATGRVEIVAEPLGYPGGAPRGRVDLMRPADRGRHPVLAGAVLHEAGHLVHTRWIPDDAAGVDAAALSAARMLEESRQEGRHLTRRPVDRMLMRAAAAHVVLAGLTSGVASRDVAATVLSLVLPRVDAGVLTDKDVAGLRQQVRDQIGADALAVFTSIWARAHRCADDDTAGMLACGRDWAAAADRFLPQPDGQGQQPGSGGGSGAGGGDENTGGASGADIGGSGAGCGDTALDPDQASDGRGSDGDGAGEGALAGALRRAMQAAAVDAARRAAQDAEQPGPRAGTAGPEMIHDHADSAARVFGAGVGISGPATAVGGRPATAADAAARARVVDALRKAQWRGPARSRVPSASPGGKVRTTALMGRHAQIAMGQRPTIDPWRRTRTRSVDRPPLLCGIVVDTSGSMRPWFDHAAVAAWSLAHAVAHTGGRTAAASFSGEPAPIIRPGDRPVLVPVLHGGGGSAGAGEALAAVDGALHLSHGVGARLAVVLTDSALPRQDWGDVQRTIDYMVGNGVGVVWAVTEDQPAWVPCGATVTTGVTPGRFGPLVASSAAQALSAADAHR